MDKTAHLELPLIAAAQAQKHVTHNEALERLDRIAQLSVVSRTVVDPPQAPQADARYIVPEAGSWAAPAGDVVQYVDGDWSSLSPRPGWRCWVRDEAVLLAFDGLDWASVSASRFDRLGINATADDLNRLNVSAPATLLDNDGSDHRLKINRASPDDTASVLFQSGYSGRAEMGVAGTRDFAVKVSHDGTQWREALGIDAESGDVRFPAGRERKQFVEPVITPSFANGEMAGPPNLSTVSYGVDDISLPSGRIYFSAFYVDRPVSLLGGLVAQHRASTSGSAVLRCGVYELGAPANDAWSPGALVADMGILGAATRGPRRFDAATPVRMTPGWYATALGAIGDGIAVRFAQWMTPGLLNYHISGSGSATTLAVEGPSVRLLATKQDAAIQNGLPQTWPTGALGHVASNLHFVRQMVVPIWRF